MSHSTLERAEFLAGDDERVIAASLACRWCLNRPSVVLVEETIGGAIATCECSACAAVARIRLSREQCLRLLVAPPDDIPMWFE